MKKLPLEKIAYNKGWMLLVDRNSKSYRKFLKYVDTQNIVVITLKFELCSSTIE